MAETKNKKDSRLLKKRYIVDYKTVKRLGPDGRVHSEFVYAGDYFYYKNPEIVRFCAGRLILAGIAAIIAFIAVFCLRNMHLLSGFFVGIPHVLTGFCLWWNIKAAWIAFKKKPPLERQQADSVNDKLRMSAWLGIILSGIEIIGSAVYVIGGNEINFDIAATFALLAIGLAYYIYVFTRRKVFDNEVRDEAAANQQMSREGCEADQQ